MSFWNDAVVPTGRVIRDGVAGAAKDGRDLLKDPTTFHPRTLEGTAQHLAWLVLAGVILATGLWAVAGLTVAGSITLAVMASTVAAFVDLAWDRMEYRSAHA